MGEKMKQTNKPNQEKKKAISEQEAESSQAGNMCCHNTMALLLFSPKLCHRKLTYPRRTPLN